MNLFDLVNRKDRCVVCEAGSVRAEPMHLPGQGHHRAVILSGGCRLRIVRADELTTLAILSASLGWSLINDGGDPQLTMMLHTRRPEVVSVPLPLGACGAGPGPLELRIDWPIEVVMATDFDLELVVHGVHPVTLLVGPLVNMRQHLLPHARGKGVEVGPGLRPLVLPGAEVEVTYLEQEDPAEWLNLYNKTGEKPAMPPQEILDRYVRSSAVLLDGFSAASLDFVFSNHVFEHLPNPLQVLQNWLHVTRPGGVVMGVVPDPRHTFDCRQPPTTALEALREEAAGGHAIGMDKYLRWCRYTEPRHTPQDLIQRAYSIHVNFFVPETLREVASILQARGLVDRVFLYTAPNHKDFAFLLRRAEPSAMGLAGH